MTNWYPKVYHPPAWGAKRLKTKQWLIIRDDVLIRDCYTCQMCKESLDYLDLSVHHIKPRKLGGKDTLNNLISLCNKCHDIAEMERLDKDEIISYIETKKEMMIKKQKGLSWHQWVYGGYTRPY